MPMRRQARPDGQGVSSVDMPVNLPDGWVYDKVFAPQGNTQHAMKVGARPLAYNRSGGGFLNALPSALPQFAYDGGTGATQEAAPQTVDAAPPVPTPRKCLIHQWLRPTPCPTRIPLRRRRRSRLNLIAWPFHESLQPNP